PSATRAAHGVLAYGMILFSPGLRRLDEPAEMIPADGSFAAVILAERSDVRGSAFAPPAALAAHRGDVLLRPALLRRARGSSGRPVSGRGAALPGRILPQVPQRQQEK